MANSAIVMYTLNIENQRGKLGLLSEPNILGKTCLELIYDGFKNEVNKRKSNKMEHKTSVLTQVELKDDIISGQVLYGNRGEKGVLYNTINENEQEISRLDSIEILYFFMIVQKRSESFLLVQKKGRKGSKEIIKDYIKDISKKNDLKIKYETFCLGNTQKEHLTEISSIWVKHDKKLGEDLADEFLHNNIEYTEQKQTFLKFTFAKFRSPKKAENYYKRIIKEKYDSENATVNLNIDGKQFKMIVSEEGVTSGTNAIDITEYLEDDSDNFERLKKVFLDYIEKIDSFI